MLWFFIRGGNLLTIMSIDIIYQDEYIIAVNKPQALLSVPGIGPDKQDCMISRLVKVFPEAKVVHRLDCYTSGITLHLYAIGEQHDTGGITVKPVHHLGLWNYFYQTRDHAIFFIRA